MGTRAQVYIYEGDAKEPFVCIYNQSDGYPSGLGRILTEFCMGIGIVNGMNGKHPRRIANGPSCFAATLVASLKDGPGGVYLYPGTADRDAIDYIYEIRVPVIGDGTNDGSARATIRCLAWNKREVPSDREEPEEESAEE